MIEIGPYLMGITTEALVFRRQRSTYPDERGRGTLNYLPLTPRDLTTLLEALERRETIQLKPAQRWSGLSRVENQISFDFFAGSDSCLIAITAAENARPWNLDWMLLKLTGVEQIKALLEDHRQNRRDAHP